jgi:F420-dependent oxidoreductase-like protein
VRICLMIEGQEGVSWADWVALAQGCERLGFDALFRSDHYLSVDGHAERGSLDAWGTVSALCAVTGRLRFGTLVSPATFRHPSVLAKAVVTADHISGGRIELGIGAGWKREEWEAYGYDFPDTPERLKNLEESLEVITRMLEPGRASFDGVNARIAGAINLPKPIQRPRVPIMVGGNGRKVTWRLGARFADEINLDNMPPDELPEAMKDIAAHCEAIGRDPKSLRVSVHIWWETLDNAPSRTDLMAGYRDAGVSRVMTLVRSSATDDGALRAFRDDAERAGAELEAVLDGSLRGATRERETAAVGD